MQKIMKAERKSRTSIHDQLLREVEREACVASFYEFLLSFWDVIIKEEFVNNWHIEYLCKELQELAVSIVAREPKPYDLIINIPPGTTKSTITTIMFPVWLWTQDPFLRIITNSYSADLSTEHAVKSRDILVSDRFQYLFPEIQLRPDKSAKTSYENTETGARYATSTGGTITGKHAHVIINDDPLNPQQAISDKERATANYHSSTVLSSRKVDKKNTPVITIMQRLHQEDPSGEQLKKIKTKKIRHICLPGELYGYGQYVKPEELRRYYIDGYLDPIRLGSDQLKELEADLGQYGYAGQVGQNPTPPKGGMIKVDHFQIVHTSFNTATIEETVRYWDKAGTADGGAYTTGTKISRIRGGRWLVSDVKRGQWESHEREQIIRETAEADGPSVKVIVEQEPGSGGKESADNTVRNLAGFHVTKDRPIGDKVYRADPWSVQVNNGNVYLLFGEWNHEYIEEHRFFPLGKYKDQVDSSAAGFNSMAGKRVVRSLTKSR